MTLQTKILDEAIKYDGSQLRSHFAYDFADICGDSAVAFTGACDVTIDHMVDLEDVHQKLFIHSKNMVHFILEHFQTPLSEAVCLQRLFVSLIQEELHDALPDLKLVRRGDDLYDEHCKLNVSIATRSPVSSLIHVGFNICSEGTPVPTKGLEDYNLNPKAFMNSVLNRYRHEWNSIKKAICKVKGVK